LVKYDRVQLNCFNCFPDRASRVRDAEQVERAGRSTSVNNGTLNKSQTADSLVDFLGCNKHKARVLIPKRVWFQQRKSSTVLLPLTSNQR